MFEHAIKETGIYVHIPFCTRKCPYCHFFVVADSSPLKRDFTQGILQEWKLRSPLLKNRQIVSLYFGGGTPTLLPPKELESILENIARTHNVDSHAEITIEANPETFNESLARDLRTMGFNRISFGVQSLDDALLKQLGRTHNSALAKRAVETAYRCGFANITIDLMYEVPKQTLDSWKKTLQEACALPITHLSLYNLTIEPETVFFKKRNMLLPLLPAPEESVQMLEAAVLYLESHGLKRYEISAFAREGYKASHNTGYWTGRPFLGLGPSSYSYWEGARHRNICSLKMYQEKVFAGDSPTDFEEKLPFPQNLCELLAVRLRLLEGVDLDLFPGLPQETCRSIEQLLSKGWLKKEEKKISLTPEGMLFYDSVAVEII